MPSLKDDYIAQKALQSSKEQQKIAAKDKSAAKKAEKVELIVQKSLTETFNRLESDQNTAIKALLKNDGKVIQRVCGINTIKDAFKTAFGFAAKRVPIFSADDIEKNTAYQDYKQFLSEQGFDVEIVKAQEANKSLHKNKVPATTMLGFGVAFIACAPTAGVGALIGGLIFAGPIPCALNNMFNEDDSAQFTIKIKEKNSAPLALEDKTNQQAEAAEFMADLNTQPIKAAIKQPIIK